LDYKTPQNVYDYSPDEIACWNAVKEEEKKKQKNKKKKLEGEKKKIKSNIIYLFKSILTNQDKQVSLTNEIPSLIS